MLRSFDRSSIAKSSIVDSSPLRLVDRRANFIFGLRKRIIRESVCANTGSLTVELLFIVRAIAFNRTLVGVGIVCFDRR